MKNKLEKNVYEIQKEYYEELDSKTHQMELMRTIIPIMILIIQVIILCKI